MGDPTVGSTRAPAAGAVPDRWTRRRVMALSVPVALGLAMPAIGSAQTQPILMVSRKRLLHETSHARLLRNAEDAMTDDLQRQVDAVKAELNAQEQELVTLRRTLPRDEFDQRVAAFDQRVREERRRAQQHAINVQNALRAERLKLVEAIGPLLEAIRADHGAQVILNADQVLVADFRIDVTDEAIARFNNEVPLPEIPELATLAPPDQDEADHDDAPQ